MRGTFWRTAGFVFAGAMIGTLAGQLASNQIKALGHSTIISWHPSADLGILNYSLALTFRVNWLTLVGALAGYFVQRRRK